MAGSEVDNLIGLQKLRGSCFFLPFVSYQLGLSMFYALDRHQ